MAALTPRGRAAIALGLAVYVVAWVFGSRALYPVATGLVLAVALAVAWVRFSLRPPEVHRHGACRQRVDTQRQSQQQRETTKLRHWMQLHAPILSSGALKRQ